MDWTSADLLQYCKDEARRPTPDAETSDPLWYRFLTIGQEHVYRVLASHVPEVLYGEPTKLTTSDGGFTYDFPGSIYPRGRVEIRVSRNGELMWPTVDWNPHSDDFVIEGNKIRIPDGQSRTFADGPYARFITPPGDISSTSEPTLQPPDARVLIALDALQQWAKRGGGVRSPEYWRDEYRRRLWGDPDVPGDVGIIHDLRQQFYGQGAASEPYRSVWYRSPDLGRVGY